MSDTRISRRIIPIPEARRGLGGVFMASGLVHAGLMVYASFLSLGWARWMPSNIGWFELCGGHLLGTVAAAVFHILRKNQDGELFVFQLVLDVVVGMGVFFAGFVSMVLLLALLLPVSFSWISLLASVWLLYYGAVLRRGSQVWSFLNI